MKSKKLHQIKSSGFKTPSNYFESIDNSIFNKWNTKNELLSINDTGFKIPDNYLESFDSRILNKKEAKIIRIFNKRKLIYISSIAATVLLLLNLFVFNKNNSFDHLDMEIVENYIVEENMNDIDIAALLTEEQQQEDITIDYPINQKNIEDYLLNYVDIEALIIN